MPTKIKSKSALITNNLRLQQEKEIMKQKYKVLTYLFIMQAERNLNLSNDNEMIKIDERLRTLNLV